MTAFANHRLNGLEPDNLLAFLALLGLLRTLEKAQLDWRTRVSWTVDEPPLRPVLRTPETVDSDAISCAAAKGLDFLTRHHKFDGIKDLAISPEDAAKRLRQATEAAKFDRYAADLWAALVSDAAVSRDGRKAEPTPLCLMFGQGHQHFLDRLASVPQLKTPPKGGRGKKRIAVSETECLHNALFTRWNRPDDTQSFRWDPNEDVRYAVRANDPTDARTKETTQHGANRLAAVGLSVLTAVPTQRHGTTKLTILGGHRNANGSFLFRWPIWQKPVSLTCIKALLGHPCMEDRRTRDALDIVEIREAKRISSGKFMNFKRAETVSDP